MRRGPVGALAITLAMGILVSGGPAVQAQEYDTTVIQERVPSAEELIESLTPDEPVKFRGLRPVEPAKLKAVSLTVQFEFDSYELSPQAKNVLSRLGSALNADQLSQYQFRIEGHTDGVGTDEHNQRLSEKRAQAVKEYLVRRFGVDPGRLATVGRGKEALLNKEDPTSPLNRRVQVVNLK